MESYFNAKSVVSDSGRRPQNTPLPGLESKIGARGTAGGVIRIRVRLRGGQEQANGWAKLPQNLGKEYPLTLSIHVLQRELNPLHRRKAEIG